MITIRTFAKIKHMSYLKKKDIGKKRMMDEAWISFRQLKLIPGCKNENNGKNE
jgi:hypothetical protein